MLKRKAYSYLVSWKNRKHDCLVIKGQRQVGKTYIVRQFAEENYDSFVEFDLFKEKSLHSAFDGDLDVDTTFKGFPGYAMMQSSFPARP